MLNASSNGTHVHLLYPKRLRIPSKHLPRGTCHRHLGVELGELVQAGCVILSVTYLGIAGPCPVSAIEKEQIDTPPEPTEVSKRKTIIIRRSSKASQQWRAPRTKFSAQDSESLLRAVRDTLEWYFR